MLGKKGFVYLCYSPEMDVYKVGNSNRPEIRLLALKSEWGTSFDLIDSIASESCVIDERRAQSVLAPYRAYENHREYYRFSGHADAQILFDHALEITRLGGGTIKEVDTKAVIMLGCQ